MKRGLFLNGIIIVFICCSCANVLLEQADPVSKIDVNEAWVLHDGNVVMGLVDGGGNQVGNDADMVYAQTILDLIKPYTGNRFLIEMNDARSVVETYCLQNVGDKRFDAEYTCPYCG